MALSAHVRGDLQGCLLRSNEAVAPLVVACALAILELDYAVHRLELKVERAEQLAGRHGEELP